MKNENFEVDVLLKKEDVKITIKEVSFEGEIEEVIDKITYAQYCLQNLKWFICNKHQEERKDEDNQ